MSGLTKESPQVNGIMSTHPHSSCSALTPWAQDQQSTLLVYLIHIVAVLVLAKVLEAWPGALGRAKCIFAIAGTIASSSHTWLGLAKSEVQSQLHTRALYRRILGMTHDPKAVGQMSLADVCKTVFHSFRRFLERTLQEHLVPI